jgi:hypothetical protein
VIQRDHDAETRQGPDVIRTRLLYSIVVVIAANCLYRLLRRQAAVSMNWRKSG